MDSEQAEHEEFSLIKRAKSLTHAGRGIGIFIRTTHNAWLQIGCIFLVVVFGAYFQITSTQWALAVLACFIVMGTEAINTAIEISIDLVSPGYHPFARDAKDVAAGAVMLAMFAAGIIGAIIFLPHFYALFTG